ncbi:MAG: hypothetical protein ACREJB_02580 [Planctomycetaceae bacterium]
MQPHRGGLILGLGIASWFTCFLLGGAAWFLGTRDLKEMAAGRMDPHGRGMTNFGRFFGLAHVGVFGAAVVFGLFYYILSPRSCHPAATMAAP